MRAYLNLAFASLIILAFIFGIYQKQKLIESGRIVYLKLAPVDPRSIMQGDYMRLRYAIERRETNAGKMPQTGFAHLLLDENNVVQSANYVADDLQLKDNEIRFKFTSNGYRAQIQPDSFLFQQGLRELYQPAKYGIFTVSGDEHLLVGLADGDLNEIKPPQAKAD
ncbi:MAG: GDYXXLXY domain-containing protein [Hyphomicrobiales bacterium]